MNADRNDTGFPEKPLKPDAAESIRLPDDWEDCYAVSALQLGMLLHSTVSPGEGVYIQQKILALDEKLDLSSFEQALLDLVDRHPVLRTTFCLESPGRAIQIVHRHPKLRVEINDWSELAAEVQQKKLRRFLDEDKRKPFDFAEGPPMRFALFRTGDAEYAFVWSSHHALMDGRSYLILLTELLDLYESRVAVESMSLPVRRPFADYIRWLEAQNSAKAESFWRNRLAGVTAPTPLDGDPQPRIGPGTDVFADATTELPVHATSTMIAVAEAHQVTVNNFVQGGWALVLSRASQCADVLFGTTKSCRSSIDGGHDMVGLCINTIPFRARVDPELTVIEFTKQLREQQLAVRGCEHASLSQIREWSEIPPQLPLFESVVVFEDFLVNTRLRSQGGGWANREFRLEERSNYPLTLSAYLDSSLILKLGYDRRRFSEATAERILSYFRALLGAMVASPESRLSKVLSMTEPSDRSLPWLRRNEPAQRVRNSELRDFGITDQVNQLGQDRDGRNRAVLEATRHHEGYWADRLAGLEVVDLACFDRRQGSAASSDETPGYFEVRLQLPEDLRSLTDSAASRSERLLTIFLAFLVRITGGEGGDVELRWQAQWDITGELEGLFAAYVPFRAPVLQDGYTILRLSEEVRRELQAIAERKTYLRDVWLRYPQLRAKGFVERGLPVAIELVERLGSGRGPRSGNVLHFEVSLTGDECRCWVAGDCADRVEVEALRSRFTAFLSAAADPAADVMRIPIHSDDDHRRLVEWNNTTTNYPRNKCAHQLFMDRASLRPNDPALIFEGSTLTYGELDARSSRLAAFLSRLGIGPGSLVGIYMERSLDTVVSLLAVMKAGAAYVPMDATYPSERIAYMLADTDLPLVLTQSSLQRRLPNSPARVVALDESWGVIAATESDATFDRATTDGLAYVIYTSGSTGKPKGVQVRHRGVTNLLCSIARTPGFSEYDKMLAVTTISFDIAALEIYLPLITGGLLELAPASVAGDGFELGRRIEESRPTVMQATPATWQMLRSTGWPGDPDLKVFCGGEALPCDLANDLVPTVKEVWNLYGPTETTIWSSVSAVKSDRKVTIGRPIANTQFYVLDRGLRLVPPGVPGELYIAGDGVAAGYLHRPELTNERFLPCPFVGEGGVMYRTGDLVRVLDDGNVEYLQRVDRQVKLHGYRIELGEIEHALLEHPSVREAIVLVREDTPGDRRLVAYIVPVPGQSDPPASQLRRFLKTSLPDYLVPGAFIVIDRMPLTPNGKVDYKALPQPSATIKLSDTVDEKPGSTAERRIAAIWRTVLGHERFELVDNFFEVGGNSLLLMEVVKRLRDEFRDPVTTVDMFSHPTVRSMALYLTEGSDRDTGRGDAELGNRVERHNDALDELRRKRLQGRQSSATSG